MYGLTGDLRTLALTKLKKIGVLSTSHSQERMRCNVDMAAGYIEWETSERSEKNIYTPKLLLPHLVPKFHKPLTLITIFHVKSKSPTTASADCDGGTNIACR